MSRGIRGESMLSLSGHSGWRGVMLGTPGLLRRWRSEVPAIPQTESALRRWGTRRYPESPVSPGSHFGRFLRVSLFLLLFFLIIEKGV